MISGSYFKVQERLKIAHIKAGLKKKPADKGIAFALNSTTRLSAHRTTSTFLFGFITCKSLKAMRLVKGREGSKSRGRGTRKNLIAMHANENQQDKKQVTEEETLNKRWEGIDD